MADLISEAQVEGPILALVHVDESSTEPTRTVLLHATRDDATLTVEEENEDFNPAAMRRTNRVATNNTVDFEIGTGVTTEGQALELLGIQDTDGQVTFDNSARQLGEDVYIEVHFFGDEPDYSSIALPADSELTYRFGDVEVRNPEVDASATPPVVSMTMWIEGDLYLNYTESGTTA